MCPKWTSGNACDRGGRVRNLLRKWSMRQNLHADQQKRRGPTRRGPWIPLTDAIYRLIRWIVVHAGGLYGALGVFLVLGLAVATLAIGVFAVVAEWMMEGVTQSFDEEAVAWARGQRSPFWDTMAIIGAALGSGTVTWIVLGLGSVLLWTTRHHYSVLLLWLSLVGGRWLSAALKELFDRPRPHPVQWELEAFGNPIHFPTSPSFPSGHAVTSVVIFGTLAYLIVRLEPTVRMRRITLAVATVLIVWIGASRVYLGVHYPSDVLAGFLAGFIWATFAVFAIEIIRYFAAIRPDVARQEKDLEDGMRPIQDTLQTHEGR